MKEGHAEDVDDLDTAEDVDDDVTSESGSMVRRINSPRGSNQV